MEQPRNAEEAVKVIEDLKASFNLKGMIWGDEQIISILDDANAENPGTYSKDYYEQIVKDVKDNAEWSILNTSADSNIVWTNLGLLVRRVGKLVQVLEDDLGVAKVTLADFSDEQLETFANNRHQKDDAYLGHLMGVSNPKVRGLRKYMEEVLADMRRIPGLLAQ